MFLFHFTIFLLVTCPYFSIFLGIPCVLFFTERFFGMPSLTRQAPGIPGPRPPDVDRKLWLLCGRLRMYPLVMTVTVSYWSHGPFLKLIYPFKMVMFHSYVSLPEGKWGLSTNLQLEGRTNLVQRSKWFSKKWRKHSCITCLRVQTLVLWRASQTNKLLASGNQTSS